MSKLGLPESEGVESRNELWTGDTTLFLLYSLLKTLLYEILWIIFMYSEKEWNNLCTTDLTNYVNKNNLKNKPCLKELS
jgi:hypothetical protein